MNTVTDKETVHDIVAVAPTFNNGRTVIDIVDRALDLCGGIVVGNDGSTDDTQRQLEVWQASRPGDSIRIVQHRVNRGKAEALKTGFEIASQSGHTHALTIDTDAQHNPSQIPDFQKPPRRILGR